MSIGVRFWNIPTFETSDEPHFSNCTTVAHSSNPLILDRALQNGDERRLRHVDVAEFLHPRLAALLFLQNLHLARHVAAVELGEHVLAEGTDVFAGDDLFADRRLAGTVKAYLKIELNAAPT